MLASGDSGHAGLRWESWTESILRCQQPKSLRYCMGLLQSRSPFILASLYVDGKVFYRRCGKDSFQVHGNDFFLTRDKE